MVKRAFFIFLPLTALTALLIFQFYIFHSHRETNRSSLERMIELQLAEAGQQLEEQYYCYRTEFEQIIPRDTAFFLLNPMEGATIDAEGAVDYGQFDTLTQYSKTDDLSFRKFLFSTETRVNARFDFEFLPIHEAPDSSEMSGSEAYALRTYKDFILNDDGLRLVDTLILDSLMKSIALTVGMRNESSYALYFKEECIYKGGLKSTSGNKVSVPLYQSRMLPEIELVFFTSQAADQWIQAYLPWILTVFGIVFLLIYIFVRAYQDLLNMNRLNAMQSDFINLMTHEFNTPLTNLKLTVDQYQEKLPEEKKNKLLSIMYNEIERMRGNFETLFQLKKLSVNEITLNREKVEANELIKLIVEVFEPTFESNEVDLVLNLEEQNTEIFVDKAQMLNVLTNLVDNSIKYRKDVLQITLSTRKMGSWMHIVVKDNGIGISKEEQKHIFDKYYRSNELSVKSSKGMGLGLFYVHRIVALHGGQVEVKSEPDNGTEILLKFPDKR